MDFSAVDVLHISKLGFIAVAVTPELPSFAPGSTHRVHVERPDGSLLEASAVVEYTRQPPIKPALLRFSGLLPTDIPVGSKIQIATDGARVDG